MMDRTGWRIAAASAIGSSHAAAGSECQDAHRCALIVDASNASVLVVAVSDGAGSARLASVGSRYAVDSAVALVTETLATQSLNEIDETTARGWLDDVQRVLTLQADKAEAELRDYACTLLLAIVSSKYAAFVQVGDGAIVISPTSPKEWSYIFWPQNGEYANTTYFVTQDLDSIPWEQSIVEVEVQDIAVFTDGLQDLVLSHATKTVHEPFFHTIIEPVRRLQDTGLSTTLSADLLEYLGSEAFNQRTDDDKTLVIASNRVVQSW